MLSAWISPHESVGHSLTNSEALANLIKLSRKPHNSVSSPFGQVVSLCAETPSYHLYLPAQENTTNILALRAL